jgi:hypothetical protein
MTGNLLFFGGPLARASNQGNSVRLYAPTTYDAGSSVAHLNEATFRAGNPNSLMTPQISYGEVNHDPGPMTVAILGDLGWDHVSIVHQDAKDTEDINSTKRILAAINSDSPIVGAPVLSTRTEITSNTPK